MVSDHDIEEPKGNGEDKVMLENGVRPYENGDALPMDRLDDPSKGFLLDPIQVDFNDEKSQTKDRYQLVYIIFLLHGIGILMPWNMFITAYSYFIDFKLKGPCSEPESEYRAFFMNYLGIVAQLPNIILNVVNLFVHLGGNIKTRIVWSIITMIGTFVVTIILAMVDSSQWIEAFFWVTMISVVILNAATGVYQNSLYGLVAILPPRYTNAVILGNNISGTITTLVSIISKIVVDGLGSEAAKEAEENPDNIRTSAIYYFLFALVMLLIAFDSYFALPLIKFFRENEKRVEADKRKEMMAKEAQGGAVSKSPPYLEVLKKIWVQALSVWFVFFVTLTNFPAIQLKIAPEEDSVFPEKYFADITCFVAFNVMAVVGNFLTEFCRWPGPRFIWVPVLLRVLFIPFFLMCRYDLTHRMLFPAVIHSDWIYFIGSILHGLTSGYYSSLCMMYAPSQVPSQHAGTAGMMSAAFLVFGIFCGCLFSLLVGKIMLMDTGVMDHRAVAQLAINATRTDCFH